MVLQVGLNWPRIDNNGYHHPRQLSYNTSSNAMGMAMAECNSAAIGNNPNLLPILLARCTGLIVRFPHVPTPSNHHHPSVTNNTQRNTQSHNKNKLYVQTANPFQTQITLIRPLFASRAYPRVPLHIPPIQAIGRTKEHPFLLQQNAGKWRFF